MSIYCKTFDGEAIKKIEETLKNIKYDDFVEFLHVVYPPHKEIDTDNMPKLMVIAKQLKCESLELECEDFVMNTKGYSNYKKLILADQFDIQDVLVSKT